MKIFKLIINEDDETGLTFNALVSAPAHNKSLITFDKEQNYLAFDKEKQMVTGVAISANQLIERFSPELGQFYVYFDEQEVEKMIMKMSKQKLLSSVNLMHDDKQEVSTMTFMEGYFVSATTRPPKELDNQNVQKGSYVMTYHIADKGLFEEIKNGKYVGYSIEGLFEQIPINFNKNQKQKDMKKNKLMKLFFGDEEQKFAEFKAKDGTIFTYDGELAEKTAMFVEVDGKKVAAPAGEIESEDGMKITIDGDGLVSKITPAEEMEGVTPQEVVDVMSRFADEFKKLNARMDAFEKSQIKKSEKFERKEEDESSKTWRDVKIVVR